MTFVGGTVGATANDPGTPINHMGNVPTIIVGSDSYNVERNRMLAHELGHAMMKGVDHATLNPEATTQPSNLNYPWHRLMIGSHSGAPGHLNRLSPTESKMLFDPRSPYLK